MVARVAWHREHTGPVTAFCTGVEARQAEQREQAQSPISNGWGCYPLLLNSLIY